MAYQSTVIRVNGNSLDRRCPSTTDSNGYDHFACGSLVSGRDNRDHRRCPLCRKTLGIAACQNEIDLEPNELGRNLASAVGEAILCATVDDDATALHPGEASLVFRLLAARYLSSCEIPRIHRRDHAEYYLFKGCRWA